MRCTSRDQASTLLSPPPIPISRARDDPRLSAVVRPCLAPVGGLFMISVGTSLHPSTSSGCSESVEGQTGPRLGARRQDRALHLIRTCSSGSERQWFRQGSRVVSGCFISVWVFTRLNFESRAIFSLGLRHAALFQFPCLLDELVGPRPHAIVISQIRPAGHAGGIHEELRRASHVLSLDSGAGVKQVITANHFRLWIGNVKRTYLDSTQLRSQGWQT